MNDGRQYMLAGLAAVAVSAAWAYLARSLAVQDQQAWGESDPWADPAESADVHTFGSIVDGAPAVVESVTESVADTLDGALMAVGFNLPGRWAQVAQRPENAGYLDALLRAERANGIPNFLLVRLAYQESRFRPDIINGGPNKAGAIGIMQIIPRWNPGVDPSDPIAAIAYAGKKLAGLYKMFGSWELALQAYNWGEGNLQKFLKGERSSLPLETSNYSRQILADVGQVTGGVA